MRKDQLRRLRFQEQQRLTQQIVKDFNKSTHVFGRIEPSKGMLETFSRKLVK